MLPSNSELILLIWLIFDPDQNVTLATYSGISSVEEYIAGEHYVG